MGLKGSILWLHIVRKTVPERQGIDVIDPCGQYRVGVSDVLPLYQKFEVA